MPVNQRRYLHALLIGLATLYALQVVSPLRMNTDSVAYLATAACLHDQVPLSDLCNLQYPRGFPTLISAMESAGISSALGIATMQLLSLILAMVIAVPLIERWLGVTRTFSLSVITLVLLSSCLIKQSVLPEAELPYVFLSFGALWFALATQRARGGRRLTWAATAIAFVALSMSFRSIGVALVPAVAWALLVGGQTKRMGDRLRQIWPILLAVAVIVGLLALRFASHYVHDGYAIMHSTGLMRSILVSIRSRLVEWGSLLLNVRSWNVWTDRIFAPIGAAVFVIWIISVWKRRTRLTAIDVYIICYTAALLIWPFGSDPRFWLPVSPFLMASIGCWWQRSVSPRRWHRPIFAMAAIEFALVGLISFTVVTRVSLSDAWFAERYTRDPSLQAEYRMAFGRPDPGDDALADTRIVTLIRRYDPLHARP